MDRGCWGIGCHKVWNNVLPPGSTNSHAPSSDSAVIDISVSSSHSESRSGRGEGNSNALARTPKGLKASICLKLTIFVGLLVVLSSGVPALVLWLKTHEQLVEEIERRLTTVSTLRQEQLRDYLYSETDKTELIGTRVIINKYLQDPINNNKSLAEFDLRSAVEVISDFVYAGIYNSKGELAITTDASVFDRNLDPSLLSSVQADGLMISHPILTRMGWMYNISRAMYQKQILNGILMTWVNATKLVSLVYDKTGLQGTGELLIGLPESMDYVRLLFPPLQHPSITILPRGGPMLQAMNGESGIMTLHDYDGVKVIVAYRPVGFMHWGLLAKLDIYEAYAPIRSVQIVIITTIVILVSLGVMASLGLAKVFASPIVELGRAAVALGHGDMTARVKKGTILLRDEIADLQDTFNSMAHQISSHQYVLEHKVRERTSDLACANEGLAKEIDERKRIEFELEKAKDAAIAANRSKSEFLANMSHEIRTPLNAIINFTELCLDTRITAEQQEHLDYVHFAAQHLLRLITDILDFSKIEAGRLEIEEIQFSLFDQLEHAVSVLAQRALKNGLELCYSFDADVPDQLIGDPGRLLQIFVNLIGNGIKFTKKGEVVVSVKLESRMADGVELLFAVRDTGLGIPGSKQTLLFHAFSQVDSSTQRLYGGTGLGLVISYKLAAAMGGTMWVESDGIEGHGSTFWFTAKFQIPPCCSNPSSPSVEMFKGMCGLVVDDNATCRTILAGLLKNWGMQSDTVGTVEEAFSSLQRAAESGHKYNVVLLDMWLNGTDVSELVSILRERPSLLECSCKSLPQSKGEGHSERPSDEDSKECVTSGSTSCTGEKSNQSPETLTLAESTSRRHTFRNNGDYFPSIILLTSASHQETTRCKRLGVRHYISKPIKHSLLLKALQSALGAECPSSSEDRASKGSESPSKSLHILVAEDNVVNQRVVVILLHKWGHTAVLARNGVEAVEQAGKEEFDLILMDVQMPVCDGFQATAQIRELEKSRQKARSTPIVAMTAHAMSGDGARCIAAGMDFYISKPLNAKKLQELLEGVARG